MWMASKLNSDGSNCNIMGLVDPNNLLRHDPQPLITRGTLQVAHSAERNHIASKSPFELLSETLKRKHDEEDIAVEMNRVKKRNLEIQTDIKNRTINSQRIPTHTNHSPTPVIISGVNLFNTSLVGRCLTQEEFADNSNLSTLKSPSSFNTIKWSDLWRLLRSNEWKWDFGEHTQKSCYFLPGYNKLSKALKQDVNVFYSEASVVRYLSDHASEYNYILDSYGKFFIFSSVAQI